jgi:uncharacterized protein involved in exopolysaccharide biosynthesis
MTLPSATAPRYESSEVQSSITVIDFFRSWYAYRYWFIIGFLIITIGTWTYSKFHMPAFYRAESKLFVGREVPKEQMIGFVDVPGSTAGRNEQYLNVVWAALAEQYLTSADLLREVAEKLKAPDPAYGNKPLDLYKALGIDDKDPERREMKLVRVLTNELMQVRQMSSTGLIMFSGDMLSPQSAKRFVDACIKVLQDRFTTLTFGYYQKALALYKDQVTEDQKRADQSAKEYFEWDAKHRYDISEEFRQERDLRKEALDAQAKSLAAMKDKIAKLELATRPEAMTAASPLKVVDWANLPLKVCRPKSGLNAVVAGALYTFVFMIVLILLNYLSWSVQTRRPGMEAEK